MRSLILRSSLILLVSVFVLALVVSRCRRQFPSSNSFDTLVREAAGRHGVSPDLVKGVIKQESNFRPWCVGNAGEVGLMQITRGAVTDWERATGRRCRFKGMLFDPRINIEIGSWYLGRAVKRWQEYGADAEVLGLAEYNAGYSNARKWVPSEKGGNALEEIRFPGTKEYIVNVLRYRDNFQEGSMLP